MAFVFSIPNGPRMLRTIKGRVPPRLRRYTCPLSRPQLISGVTRDSTGAPLGGMTVKLYNTNDDKMQEVVTSDANGNYTFSSIVNADAYYIVEYKTGPPDVRGTSDNTLVGI